MMDSMRTLELDLEQDGSEAQAAVLARPRPPAVTGEDAPLPERTAVRNEEVGPAHDPLDAYLRQIGHTELLSREDELSLAKRIDAAQQRLLAGLCRVPRAIERVGEWAAKVREGQLRADFLIDGLPQQEDSPEGDEDAEVVVAPASEDNPQLEFVSLLGAEVAALAQKRIAALLRGKDISRPARRQLNEVLSRAAEEIANLRLQQDRIAELLDELESDARKLRHTERELLRLAGTSGISREAVIERLSGREADPNWIEEAASGSDRAWRAFARANSEVLNAFGDSFRDLTSRLGLSIEEARSTLVEVSRARRELKRRREEMVQAHLRLVVAIAKKYRGYSSLDFGDLIQEGNLGLMRAVEKYDWRHGVKVSTYASWWIRQSITRAMADRGRMIRVPVHMAQTARKVQRERNRLHQQKGREPGTEEIAARSGIAKAHVEQVLALVQEPTSLDIPVGEDGDTTLAELIEAPDAVNPLSAADAASLMACVAEALSELSPREERILRMRFGIGMSDHTLEQVGQMFGVTRERIRQIEAKALEKLRAPSRLRKLSTFAES